jgi:hypothetical protein
VKEDILMWALTEVLNLNGYLGFDDSEGRNEVEETAVVASSSSSSSISTTHVSGVARANASVRLREEI